jgi:hypothetical protein
LEALDRNIIDDSRYSYDPQRDRQTEIIYQQTAEQLQAVRQDVSWLSKKFIYTMLVTCSVVSGITLALWGLSQTVFFNGYPKNGIIFGCSFILYLPCCCYIKVMCFPDKNAFFFRQYLQEKRLWRKKIFSTRYKVYMGYDEEERQERIQKHREALARMESERLEKLSANQREELRLRRELAIKIGKNTPKLGTLPPSHFKEQRLDDVKQRLNIVISRHGQFVTQPPPILPPCVLETGTADKIPNYAANRFGEFRFEHPDTEGETYALDNGFVRTKGVISVAAIANSAANRPQSTTNARRDRVRFHVPTETDFATPGETETSAQQSPSLSRSHVASNNRRLRRSQSASTSRQRVSSSNKTSKTTDDDFTYQSLPRPSRLTSKKTLQPHQESSFHDDNKNIRHAGTALINTQSKRNKLITYHIKFDTLPLHDSIPGAANERSNGFENTQIQS